MKTADLKRADRITKDIRDLKGYLAGEATPQQEYQVFVGKGANKKRRTFRFADEELANKYAVITRKFMRSKIDQLVAEAAAIGLELEAGDMKPAQPDELL